MFRIWRLGFGVSRFRSSRFWRFGVRGLFFHGSGCHGSGSQISVSGLGIGVTGFGIRVSGFRVRDLAVQGFRGTGVLSSGFRFSVRGFALGSRFRGFTFGVHGF